MPLRKRIHTTVSDKFPASTQKSQPDPPGYCRGSGAHHVDPVTIQLPDGQAESG